MPFFCWRLFFRITPFGWKKRVFQRNRGGSLALPLVTLQPLKTATSGVNFSGSPCRERIIPSISYGWFSMEFVWFIDIYLHKNQHPHILIGKLYNSSHWHVKINQTSHFFAKNDGFKKKNIHLTGSLHCNPRDPIAHRNWEWWTMEAKYLSFRFGDCTPQASSSDVRRARISRVSKYTFRPMDPIANRTSVFCSDPATGTSLMDLGGGALNNIGSPYNCLTLRTNGSNVF